MNKGYLLVVDGLGGSGKSSISERIQNWFEDAQIPCVRTFEPGGTPAANFLRRLCREGIEGAEPLTPMAEALLFNAARAQHVETVIKPALERGDVVLCDRYLLSTLGYQGVGRMLSVYTLREIHHHAIGLMPDMTILMEGDPEVFMKRITPTEKGSDQFDNWDKEKYDRIQFFFEWEASVNPEKYFTVDAEQSAEQVFAQVIPLLMQIQNDRLKRPQVASITCPPKSQSTVTGSALGSIVPGFVENKGIFDTSVKEKCDGCGNECTSKNTGGAGPSDN